MAVTEELRDLFEQIHSKMSAGLSFDQQFQAEEQMAMFSACRIAGKGGRTATAEEVTACESDLCELLHYLVLQGLPVAWIDAKIRTFSQATSRLARRLCYEQQEAAKKDRRPLFYESSALEAALA